MCLILCCHSVVGAPESARFTMVALVACCAGTHWADAETGDLGAARGWLTSNELQADQ
jgi:hypothetical protein